MDMKTCLNVLTEQSGIWSQNKVAAELGITSQNMSNKMNAKTGMKVDLAVDYLEVLGYRLAAVPAHGRLPHGSIEISVGGE